VLSFIVAPVRAVPPIKPFSLGFSFSVAGMALVPLLPRFENLDLSQFFTFLGLVVGDGAIGVTSSLFAASAVSRIRKLDWSSIDVRIGAGVALTSRRSARVSSGAELSLAAVGNSVADSGLSTEVPGTTATGSDLEDLLRSLASRSSSFLAAFSSAFRSLSSSLSCSVMG